METTAHYVTFAAFLVDERKGTLGGALVDCSIADESLYGKAIMRKLCACGSPIEHDNNLGWCCSNSGEQLEVYLNNEPLNFDSEPPIINNLQNYRFEFNHPEHAQVLLADQSGCLHAFVKVSRQNIWIISDPLPISDYLLIKPIEADLILVWHLDIGAGLPNNLDIEIPLNLMNPTHERYLEKLVSGADVFIYLVDEESLSIIAWKPFRPWPSAGYSLQEARQLAGRLPTDPTARAEALRDFTEGQELSVAAWAEKQGLLWCTEFDRRIKFGPLFTPAEFEEHKSSCKLCSRVWRNLSQ